MDATAAEVGNMRLMSLRGSELTWGAELWAGFAGAKVAPDKSGVLRNTGSVVAIVRGRSVSVIHAHAHKQSFHNDLAQCVLLSTRWHACCTQGGYEGFTEARPRKGK